MKKILTIVESICSIGLMGSCIMLLVLQKTISYEAVSTFEKTPKSNLFIVMAHNPILGYLFVVFGVILAIATVISLFFKLRELRIEGTRIYENDNQKDEISVTDKLTVIALGLGILFFIITSKPY